MCQEWKLAWYFKMSFLDQIWIHLEYFSPSVKYSWLFDHKNSVNFWNWRKYCQYYIFVENLCGDFLWEKKLLKKHYSTIPDTVINNIKLDLWKRISFPSVYFIVALPSLCIRYKTKSCMFGANNVIPSNLYNRCLNITVKIICISYAWKHPITVWNLQNKDMILQDEWIFLDTFIWSEYWMFEGDISAIICSESLLRYFIVE